MVRQMGVGACGWGMGTLLIGHHRLPQAVDEHASKAGLRAVATFEATKGVLALLVAVILMAVRHRMEDLAEDFFTTFTLVSIKVGAGVAAWREQPERYAGVDGTGRGSSLRRGSLR